MAKRMEQTYGWSLDENHLTDGANIGGYNKLTVSNHELSKFAVKVYFDDQYQFGLGHKEEKTVPINGADILVTVKPLSPPKQGEYASGVFYLQS